MPFQLFRNTEGPRPRMTLFHPNRSAVAGVLGLRLGHCSPTPSTVTASGKVPSPPGRNWLDCAASPSQAVPGSLALTTPAGRPPSQPGRPEAERATYADSKLLASVTRAR